MNCPYCGFEFKVLAINAREIPELAPAICEDCGGISWYCNGTFAKATDREIALIKQSPAWRDVLGPAHKIIMENKRRRM